MDHSDRHTVLNVILPRAQLFQEKIDSLQQWLISVDQDLAELRSAERGMLHLQEATGQAKVRSADKIMHYIVLAVLLTICTLTK